MHAQKDGAHDLLQRLEDNLDAFSPAERTIANFILTNRGGIAFETANSIAEKLQVSPVTVGRFSRKMGYRHFKDLKAGLRTAMSGVPWLVGDQLSAFVGAGGGGDHRGGRRVLELAGIIEVYALAETPGWKEIVTLLARSRRVHVAGFQTERGVAMTLAHLLQYAREGVTLPDSSAGNFHEVLADDDAAARYSGGDDHRQILRLDPQIYRSHHRGADRGGIVLELAGVAELCGQSAGQ